MAEADKIKWDKKYTEKERLRMLREPVRDLVKFINEPQTKTALDVASGVGRNAIYLANNGYDVDAVDISTVALDKLNEYAGELDDPSRITAQLVDLEHFTPTQDKYGIIVMANYLDRQLVPRLANALAPNGLLVIDTYMRDDENGKSGTNPDFLLKSDELPTLFDRDRFELLSYREYWSEGVEQYRMRKGAIVARKKSQ